MSTADFSHISWLIAIIHVFSAGLLSIGQIVGSLLTALISDLLGRKATTMGSCLPGLIGWLILGLANNEASLLIGRFMVGLCMGLEGSLHSLFVVELMSKDLRGPFVTSGVIMITSGILAVFVLGTVTHWKVTEVSCCARALYYSHAQQQTIHKAGKPRIK